VLLQLMNIYNKGVAMAQINQTGRQLYDDMSDKARFTDSKSVIYNQEYRRLCAGGSTYLWNTENDRSSRAIKNHYADEVNANSINATNISVMRVADPKASYCADVNLMPDRSSADASLLAGGNVSVLAFTIDQTVPQDLIKMRVVISTSGGNKPTENEGSWRCLDAGTNSYNPFCYFGEFNFLIYTRGGSL